MKPEDGGKNLRENSRYYVPVKGINRAPAPIEMWRSTCDAKAFQFDVWTSFCQSSAKWPSQNAPSGEQPGPAGVFSTALVIPGVVTRRAPAGVLQCLTGFGVRTGARVATLAWKHARLTWKPGNGHSWNGRRMPQRSIRV